MYDLPSVLHTFACSPHVTSYQSNVKNKYFRLKIILKKVLMLTFGSITYDISIVSYVKISQGRKNKQIHIYMYNHIHNYYSNMNMLPVISN